MRREIRRSRAAVDEKKHELELVKAEFSYAENTLIKRTRKLAALFGGMLKSDEELIQKIQELLESTDQQESRVKTLHTKLEELQDTQKQCDAKIKVAESELEQEQQILQEARAEQEAVLQQLSTLNAEMTEKRSEKAALSEKITAIANAINSKMTDPDFPAKLAASLAGLEPKTAQLLHELANVLGIDPPAAQNPDVDEFVESMAIAYEKLLQKQHNAEEAKKKITGENEAVNLKIQERRKKNSRLRKEIRKLENDIADEEQQVSLKRQHMAQKTQEKRENLLSRLKIICKTLNVHPASKTDPKKIMKGLAVSINEAIDRLEQIRQIQEKKRVRTECELKRGICVVESATSAISKANHRLFRELHIDWD
jgi:chromosome segregation ATPase